MSSAIPFGLLGPAAIAAAVSAALFGSVSAQGESGEHTYLAIKLENVSISRYPQAILDMNISEILAGNGSHVPAAQISAASRDALSKLSARLAGRTGTAELVICVPPGSQTCIEIVCKLCSAD